MYRLFSLFSLYYSAIFFPPYKWEGQDIAQCAIKAGWGILYPGNCGNSSLQKKKEPADGGGKEGEEGD